MMILHSDGFLLITFCPLNAKSASGSSSSSLNFGEYDNSEGGKFASNSSIPTFAVQHDTNTLSNDQQAKQDATWPAIYCLIVRLDAQIDLKYERDGKTHSKSFELSSRTVNVSRVHLENGTCGANAESIDIEWSPVQSQFAWRLRFDISKRSKSSMFAVDSLSLWLNPAMQNETGITQLYSNDTTRTKLTSQLARHYSCVNEQRFELRNAGGGGDSRGSSITFSHMSIAAFLVQSDFQITSEGDVCQLDSVVNNIVPIAVGATLAAMILIVLVVYIIGKKRESRGYQTL